VLKKFNKYPAKWLNSIYPWHCSICGGSTSNKSICQLCIRLLPLWNKEPSCEVCGLQIENDTDHTLICGQCQKQPPYYDCLSAVYWYEPPINDIITQYKYLNYWENAQTLIELCKNSFIASHKDSLIIPVPSHPSRVRQRGFNAVYELVQLFKRQHNFYYDDKLVSRCKNTETQTGKTKAQRKRNLRNAFTVNHLIEHDYITIIDEVVTTGATVNELSRCLKNAGVKKVSVWALARTRNKRYIGAQ